MAGSVISALRAAARGWAQLLSAAALLLAAAPAAAATVQTADGEMVRGTLQSLEDNRLVVQPADGEEGGDAAAVRIPLADIVTVWLTEEPTPIVRRRGALIVDNDGIHLNEEKAGSVGLKAGKHLFTLIYFQATDNRSLRVSYSGPNMSRRAIPDTALSRPRPGTELPAPADPAFTPEGLRLPLEGVATMRQLDYAYYEADEGQEWKSVADVLRSEPRTTGFAGRIDLALAERSDRFGLKFSGLIEVPADGEYTFYVASDDGSQLYIGEPPPAPAPRPQPRDPGADRPAPGDQGSPQALTQWQIGFGQRDRLTGGLVSWSDRAVALRSDLAGRVVEVPLTAVREAWQTGLEDFTMPEHAASPDALDDVAFVRRDGEVQAIRGLVQGIDGGVMRFRYAGQDRRIALDRLVGVVLAPRPSEPQRALMHTAYLAGGDVITGAWTALEEGEMELRPAWTEPMRIPLPQVTRIDTQNGRLVYLSDWEPAAVERTGFFGGTPGFRRDQSLEGEKLVVGDREFEKGIAVQPRCVLHYDLGGGFERFRATLGFQQPEGRLGWAAVRVLGDGKALYEDADARGDEPPAEIDVDVAGVERLSLEVDFGADQHVGDRVVWADARLLRRKE